MGVIAAYLATWALLLALLLVAGNAWVEGRLPTAGDVRDLFRGLLK